MTTKIKTTDVAICGGGPVGMALALSLNAAGRQCILLDARPAARAHGRPDPRTLAVSYGSSLLLSRIGVWDALPTTPIHSVHVSQQGGFGRTELNARDEHVPALGYVVALAELDRVLHQACAGIARLHDAKVTAVDRGEDDTAIVSYTQGDEHQTIAARLVAIADGGDGAPGDAGDRAGHDYAQTAILADVTPAEPHRNRAWERFARTGPIALLPKNNDYALVWSVQPETAEDLANTSDAKFLERLMLAMGSHAGGKIGRLVATSPRSRFPLGLRYRRELAGERTIALGNAAQTLHPVAGQGLNLGLRDVWALTTALNGVEDCGNRAALAAYAAGRRLDRYGTIRFTDLLARVFTVDSSVIRVGRGAALTLFDLLPPARHFLARRMIYGASAWP